MKTVLVSIAAAGFLVGAGGYHGDRSREHDRHHKESTAVNRPHLSRRS